MDAVVTNLKTIGWGVCVGVVAGGYGVVVALDTVAGGLTGVGNALTKLEHTVQDFALNPFGALSAVENAAQELHPILGNVTAFLVDDYQGLVHYLSDGDVEFYDNVSDYLNSIHENTNELREWSEGAYNDLYESAWSGGVYRQFCCENTVNFVTQEKLEEHYSKHGPEIKKLFGLDEYTIEQYLSDANYIIKHGAFSEKLYGYVHFMKNRNFGFVGLDRKTGGITTFHIKNIDELKYKDPSLGLE